MGTDVRVLVFEAAGHLLAAPAGAVDRIAGPDEALPGGAVVIDAAGLLSEGGEPAKRGCRIVLKAPGDGPPVAITAGRAHEVRLLDAERLLPLPAFLFSGANPFVGLAPPGEGGGQAIFVLAGPERLLSLTSRP